MRALATAVAAAQPPSPPSVISQPPSRSAWHSPVPYLFGGLAAMLGLVAFALLILACSYWKLNRNDRGNEEDDRRDLENGIEKTDSEKVVMYDKVLVIMAGDQNPSFLATPAVCCQNSEFVDANDKNDSDEEKDDDG